MASEIESLERKEMMTKGDLQRVERNIKNVKVMSLGALRARVT